MSGPAGRIPALVVVLLILDSLHFVFARLLLPHISPGVSALYVMLVSTLEVGIFGAVTRRLHWETARRHLRLFIAIGILIGVSMMANYEAVAFIDPGTASLLNQTSILFSLGFGFLLFHDRLAPRQLAGAALAVVGVFVIAFQPGDYLRLGALIAVASAFMYALHAALSKLVLNSSAGREGDAIDFVDFFFFRLLFTAAALGCLSVIRGALALPTLHALALVALVGTVDVVLSRTLYYLALRRLTMSLHTLILTLSPIAALTWSVFLFGTRPTPQQLLGGAAVIAGMVLVSRTGRTQGTSAKVAPVTSADG
jgi:drug/metabolite transporter (DMT)-like permease